MANFVYAGVESETARPRSRRDYVVPFGAGVLLPAIGFLAVAGISSPARTWQRDRRCLTVCECDFVKDK